MQNLIFFTSIQPTAKGSSGRLLDAVRAKEAEIRKKGEMHKQGDHHHHCMLVI